MSAATDIFSVTARLLADQNVRLVIDVGAYDGDTAVIYSGLFPGAIVHAIEPDTENFEKLQQSAVTNPSIRPHHFAAGSTEGSAVLHRNGYDQTHSLLPRPDSGKRYFPEIASAIGVETVPVLTLDRFCRDQQIDFVDLLKLDIQGGEVDALNGAVDLLTQQRIAVICLEVAFVPHYEKHPMLVDVWQLMARHRYTPYDLHPCLHGSDGQLRYADALFVSPDFRRDVIDPMTSEP